MNTKAQDVSAGDVFSYLTAVRFEEKRGNIPMWMCMCKCGSEVVVSKYELLRWARTRRAKTISCGCARSKSVMEGRDGHGLSQSREYRIWSGIKKRCLNQRCRAYKDYGGRGITICERWLDFKCFIADMGKCPDGYMIERKDNDAGYSSENCIWASRTTQNRNTRRNRVVEAFGERLTLTEWAERYGLSVTLLHARLGRLRWPIEKALTTPARPTRRPSPT